MLKLYNNDRNIAKITKTQQQTTVTTTRELNSGSEL